MKKPLSEWDPDFTKLTAEEAAMLAEARSGEYVDDEDVNWDEILGSTGND